MTESTPPDSVDVLSADTLRSTVEGSEGAREIGISPVAGAPGATNVQDALENFAGGADEDIAAVYDFVNEARNTLMSGGGAITWGTPVSNRVKWTGRFILMPVSTRLNAGGFEDVNYPASASVLDASGAQRRNADGINLGAWDALWFDSATSTFAVRSYGNGESQAFFDNEEAFLICVRNADTERLHFRNGLSLSQGQTSANGAAATVAAADVTYAGSTNLAATNVEAALDELDTEKASTTALSNHTGAASGAHAATAISYAGSANLASTTVEAALDELDAEKLAIAGGVLNGNLQFNSQLQAGAQRPGPMVGFEFLLASDQAGIYAQELAADHSDFVFYLSDNPDQGSVDRFVFGGNSWMQRANPEWGIKPKLNALELWGLDHVDLNTHMHINGYLNLRPAKLLGFKLPSGTTSDALSTNVTVIRNGQVTANVVLNGSTLLLTPDVSGFTGTHPRYYRVTITGTGSPNTFAWRAQSNVDSATGVAVGPGPITLDQGVTISFNGTTGGVLNETFEFWVLPAARLQANGTDVVKPDGYLNPARAGTGTRDGTKFLRDDGTWQAVAGGGGSASSVSYAGSTNLSSTTVEAALDELDAEKQRTTPAATPATTSRTLLVTEEYVRASGTITLTLPDASLANPDGYIIQNVGTGRIDVVAASGDNIQELASVWTDTKWDVIHLRPADANTWGITLPAGGMDTGGTVSVAPGTGITSATLAPGSNAKSGRVTVVNGGALIQNATIFTLSFSLVNAPKGAFFTGANVPGARVVWNVYADYSTLTATGAPVRIVDDGLVANTTYEFYYELTG